MARLIALLILLWPISPAAEVLVAAHTLRAQTVLNAQDLALQPGDIPGALTDPNAVIGLETRVAIYAGRPIRMQALGPPALVDRNQIIPLIFRSGGLLISVEGRALDRGGLGDAVRVMNSQSKTVVMAKIGPDGAAHIPQR